MPIDFNQQYNSRKPQEEAPQEENLGIIDYAADIGRGVVGGALDAAESIVQLPNMFSDEETERIMPELETKTALGDITNTITQGALGLVGAGKFIKAAGVISSVAKFEKGVKAAAAINNATTRGGQIAGTAFKSALGDFAVFDENEERLSNIINEVPSLANPVTEFLSAKETDTKAEARLKLAIESAGLGVALDGLLSIIKASKSYGRNKLKDVYDKSFTNNMASTLQEQAENAARRIDDEAGSAAEKEIKKENDVNIDEMIKLSSGAKYDDFRAYKKHIINNSKNKALKKDIEKLSSNISHNVEEVLLGGNTDIVEAFAKVVRENPAFTKIGEKDKHLYRAVMDKVKDKIGYKMSHNETIASTKAMQNQDLIDKDMARLLEIDSNVLNTLSPRLLYYRLDAVAQTNRFVKELENNLLNKGVSNESLTKAYEEYATTLARTQTIISSLGRALGSLRIKPDKQELSKLLNNLEEEAFKNTKKVSVKNESLNIDPSDIKALAGDGAIIDSKRLNAATKLIDMGLDMNNPAHKQALLGLFAADETAFLRMLTRKETSNLSYASESLMKYFVNNLLSSPVTHLFNFTGTTMKMLFSPLEKIMGGALRGDSDSFMKGVREFSSYKAVFSDSLKAVKLALKTGGNILDSTKNYPKINATRIAEDLKMQYVSSAYKNSNINPVDAYYNTRGEVDVIAKALGYVGSFLQTPLRAMGAVDEFFKQMAYRSKVYSNAVEKAINEGISDKAAFIQKEMDNAFYNGAGTNKEALAYAMKQTWTEPLDSTTQIGKAAIAIKSIPALRPFVPFITTPTNLIKDIIEHTPFMRHAPTWIKREYEKGGEAAAALEGKAALGMALGFMGVSLAADGLITGAYPSDSEEKQLWISQGRLPYSIRLGDKWIPYNRLDPFGAFFGMAATTYDRAKRDDTITPLTYLSVILENIGNKTYLSGVMDLMEAVQNPETPSLKYTAQNLLSGLTPFSSAMRFTARQIDGQMKETGGEWDLRFASNIPFLSDKAPAKYNFITGQTQEQSYLWSNAKDNIALEKVVPYAESIRGGAPSKIIKGVKLSPGEYSELSRLQGQIKIGGKTLMQAIEKLTESYAWKRAGNKFNSDGKSIRAGLLEDVMGRYKKAAQREFLKGNTAFTKRLQEEKENIMRSESYKIERFVKDGINISSL